jgi:ATP-dependent phosphofructokinase / diphosphate-dependent phosphofructokinase
MKKKSKMNKHIGILTAGGDSPGLNAAIRGIGKTAIGIYDMHVLGFMDGFRGLMENRMIRLDGETLSGILTLGGTILGTSRDKPNKMQVGGKVMDMTEVIVENYHKHHLDALVCIGGGGTQKNAYHLMQHGLNVITLPKTIDNDVYGTDVTFGFDTAMGIAVEAIDRLHSTAYSHHRIIIVEIMGHNTGWLTLGSGVSGGADVILIPEIPYDIEVVAESILQRERAGKHFSIIAVAEGAISIESFKKIEIMKKRIANSIDDPEKSNKIKAELKEYKSKVIGVESAKLSCTAK